MGQIHVVEQGECFVSIAAAHGFADYRVLYDHPDNASLRQRRRSPKVLLPGDRVFVPDRAQKDVDCATGRDHRFRMRRPSTLVRIRLQDEEGEAFAGKRYELVVDGEVFSGVSSDDGMVERRVPADARSGELVVWLDDEATDDRGADGATGSLHRMALHIGHLDPIDETRGLQSRLRNLGFHPGPLTGELDEATREALRAFQRKQGLDATGDPDLATRDALVDIHGGH